MIDPAAALLYAAAPVLFVLLLVFDARYGLDEAVRTLVDAVKSVQLPSFRVLTPESSPDAPGSAREMVTCSTCGREMEAKDMPDHKAAQHRDDGSEDSGRSAPAVSRGDLVDDYTLPPELRDPEESERTPLPELPDRDEDPLGYRRPYYDRLREELDRRGSVTITGNTHVGSVRGYHVVQEFRSAVRRHPDDSLERYEIDDAGGCPVEIRRAA